MKKKKRKKKKKLDKELNFTEKQIEAINIGLKEGLNIIKGPPGSGKTDIAVEIINNLYLNKKNEKILIITHSNNVLNDLCKKLIDENIIDINSFDIKHCVIIASVFMVINKKHLMKINLMKYS